MALRNGFPVETNREPAGFYPPDISDVNEQTLLVQKTGKEIQKLSRLQVFWNDAREVTQRNDGLLLIMAGEALFAITDAIVKTLQKVDPPVTTLQVRLRSTLTTLPAVQSF